MSTLARAWCVNHALHDAQSICALTKVCTVLNVGFMQQKWINIGVRVRLT